MSELALIQPDPEPIRAEIAPVVAKADSLIVRNIGEHEEALSFLGVIGAAEKRIKAAFADPKKKAHDAHKAITALESSLLAPLADARGLVSRKCGAFEAEQRRIAEEERKKREAEELARQEEQRLLDAAMAADETEAEEALTEPLPPPVVEVRPQIAKVAGISTRQLWSAKVTDKRAFIEWALKADQLYLIEPNMPMLNQMAKSEREQMAVPGVEAVSVLTHAVR